MKAAEKVPLMVRLPADVHASLKAAAEQNDNSLNVEIIRRLRRSFEGWKQ